MVLSAGGCWCGGLGAAGNGGLLEVGKWWDLRFGGCSCLALNEVFRGRDREYDRRRAPSIFVY